MWSRLAMMIPSLLQAVIGSVETLKGAGNGAAKAAAVKDIVLISAEAVDGVVGRDVMKVPEVSDAFDAMNNAIVAFRNLVTKHQAVVVATTPAAPHVP